MCFSSAASFGAAALLTVAGIASIARVRHSRELLFAAVPIIFALQQAAEGLIWLTSSNSALAPLRSYLTYFFLLLAESVWPVWVPLSLLLLERSSLLRAFLALLLALGLFTSVYLTFYLMTYGVEARVEACHIIYAQHLHSPYSVLTSLPYLMATLLPFFISGARGMRWLGVAVAASYIFSKASYDYYLLSVWCFYAGMISIGVYLIIKGLHKGRGGSLQIKY